jgi:branched-chain amino acid transport system ATP-binding protein/branched-chain amino acid transport system permease protein
LVVQGILLVLLLSGPKAFPTVISAITSTITFPITGSLHIAANRYEVFNADLLLVYLIAVIGVNLVALPGLLTLSQSAIFALGAYVVAIATTRFGWSLWPAIVLAGIFGGLVGLVLGLPSLRLGKFTLAMVTVGYAYVITDLAVEWGGLTGGADGIRGVPLPSPFATLTDFYWVVAIAAGLAYIIAHNLIRSPLGRAARSIDQQPVAAQSLGIDVYRVKLTAFAISSVFVAVAGGLYAPVIGFVAPDSATVDLAVLILLMVFLGGAGTVAGPIIGTVLLFRIPIEIERVSSQSGDWSLIIYGTVLLLSVFLFPRGVMSGWWWVQQRFRKSARGGASPPVVSDIRRAVRDVKTEQNPVAATAVEKRLGGVRALQGVDLTLRPGEVHALIGPNGSGKTTFLNAVCGYIQPDGGRIALFGVDNSPAEAHRRARLGLGRTFQTPFIFGELSCLDNVIVGVDSTRRASLLSYAFRLPTARKEEKESRARALAILDALGLGDQTFNQASTLPPGRRRFLEIARTLAVNPQAILMDEPAAGLSAGEMEELASVVRDLRDAGIAILLVEHHIDFVMRLADVVTVIDFGRVIAYGPPDLVKTDPQVIAAYLGSPEPAGRGLQQSIQASS